jgi:hypothetical protein
MKNSNYPLALRLPFEKPPRSCRFSTGTSASYKQGDTFLASKAMLEVLGKGLSFKRTGVKVPVANRQEQRFFFKIRHGGWKD